MYCLCCRLKEDAGDKDIYEDEADIYYKQPEHYTKLILEKLPSINTAVLFSSLFEMTKFVFEKENFRIVSIL
jgi:hypothetical protein